MFVPATAGSARIDADKGSKNSKMEEVLASVKG